MTDFDSIRERIADQLMAGETVAGIRLQDILDVDFELAQRLAAVWKSTTAYRQVAYDDLETACRKVVERYVTESMDEEVTAEMEAAHESEFTYAENL